MTRIQDNGKLTEYSAVERQEPRVRTCGQTGRHQERPYADNELRKSRVSPTLTTDASAFHSGARAKPTTLTARSSRKATSLSLPVITEINGIYSLTVESVV